MNTQKVFNTNATENLNSNENVKVNLYMKGCFRYKVNFQLVVASAISERNAM